LSSCNWSVLLWTVLHCFLRNVRYYIMNCISLAILSRLSRFPGPAVGTSWPFCVDVPWKPINQCRLSSRYCSIVVVVYVKFYCCITCMFSVFVIIIFVFLCKFTISIHRFMFVSTFLWFEINPNDLALSASVYY